MKSNQEFFWCQQKSRTAKYLFVLVIFNIIHVRNCVRISQNQRNEYYHVNATKRRRIIEESVLEKHNKRCFSFLKFVSLLFFSFFFFFCKRKRQLVFVFVLFFEKEEKFPLHCKWKRNKMKMLHCKRENMSMKRIINKPHHNSTL